MSESPYSPPKAALVETPIPTQFPADPEYQGVKGWLFLFCLGITVFLPLTSIITTATSFDQVAKVAKQYPLLVIYNWIEAILILGIACFSFYTGISLWRIRPGAVQLAKRFLISLLVVRMVTSLLPFLAGLPPSAHSAMLPEALGGLFKSALYAGVWYSFLLKSKRVANTYEPQH